MFTVDWISWPVFLWFVGVILLTWQVHRKQAVGASRQARRRAQRANDGAPIAQKILGDDFPLAAAGKIILMGALFALFSAMLSVQLIWLNPFADLRYYMGALPLLLAMKGLFVEWAWRRHAIAGAVALSVLLFTSVGAAPFNMVMYFSGQKTLGLHLFEFVREVHRPYRDSISVVSSYLLQNAERDDLVYVQDFAYREVLTFYAGDHVRFCCILDETTPLPKDKIAALNAPLYIEQNTPDWIIFFRQLQLGTAEQFTVEPFTAIYEVVAQLEVYPYPTQRPELNMHAFSPLDPGGRACSSSDAKRSRYMAKRRPTGKTPNPSKPTRQERRRAARDDAKAQQTVETSYPLPSGSATASPLTAAISYSRQDVLAFLALGLLVVVPYLPAMLWGGFVWDDRLVTNSEPVQDISGLWKIWFSPGAIGEEGHYWPLVYTTFWLEHKLWGYAPAGYHVVNVLLHLANTLLLWHLLRRLAVPGAWMVAAVFARASAARGVGGLGYRAQGRAIGLVLFRGSADVDALCGAAEFAAVCGVASVVCGGDAEQVHCDYAASGIFDLALVETRPGDLG